MDSTGSLLKTIVERIRFDLNLPSEGGKFDNDYLVRHLIGPGIESVMSRVNANQDNLVVNTFDFSIVKDQRYYQLPPHVQELWLVAEYDSDGDWTYRWDCRNFFHPYGSKWRLEGNMIVFDPTPKRAYDLKAWYTPSAGVSPHYATDGQIDENSSDEPYEFLLSSSPSLGSIDRRPNAYVGMMLRVLPTSGVIEERIIDSYDVEAGSVRVRVPFDFQDVTTSDFGGEFPYEIVPLSMEALASAVGTFCARSFAPRANLSKKQYDMLGDKYREHLKTLRQNLCNMNQVLPKHFVQMTYNERGDAWSPLKVPRP